jgi:hypothetical protein
MVLVVLPPIEYARGWDDDDPPLPPRGQKWLFHTEKGQVLLRLLALFIVYRTRYMLSCLESTLLL